MKIPTIAGVIDRRILANFRVQPDALARTLPSPFRPQLVDGWGIAGICLIRLRQVRPRFIPAFVGIGSENAAHRIAVEWDDAGQLRTGVFVPRRDTSSWLNTLAGGRVFPGVHHQANFDVRERDTHFHVAMASRDGETRVVVDGDVADELPPESVFASVDEVSQFFQAGSLGYSPASTTGQFDGLELRTQTWSVQPLKVNRIESTFFDDRAVFPNGVVEFDNALLMRGIDHTWHGRKGICSMA